MVDLTAILAVSKEDRYETFGADPLRLVSVWSPKDLGLGGTCAATDSWLECGLEDWLIQPSAEWDGTRLGLFFGPEVLDRLDPDLRPGDGPLDITGHFGDVASEDCRPEDREGCRDLFVVTDIELGA